MINSFRGKYFFLSSFYIAPVMYKHLMFTNNEAAFHSDKSFNSSYQLRLTKMGPSEAKREGRKIKLRPDWEEVKDQVMEDIVRDKFTRNLDIRRLLLDTGDEELIEGNDWGDTYWGVCNGVGKNMLGKILMKIREELRNSLICFLI